MTDEQAPVSLQIDFDTFTIEEVEMVEEAAGVAFKNIGAILSGDGPSAKLLRVLAFISQRRTDPEATLEGAGKVRLTALFDGKKGDALPPPPPAA